MKIPRLKFKKSLYLPLVASLALVLILTFVNYANAQPPLTRDSGARVGDNQNSQTAAPNAIGMQMTDNQKKDKPGNQDKTLTNRQGHPVYDNQNTKTVGDRGPTVLENYNLLEKITHFDRERIPERVDYSRVK